MSSDTQTIADTRRERRLARNRVWSPISVVTAALLFAGICVLTYPAAGNWFSTAAHNATVSGYVSAVDHASAVELARLRAEATSYNANLPNGPLRDPYILNQSGQSVDLSSGREAYEEQLSLSQSGAMARLVIPKIDVDLPIFHGTDEDTLRRGVGHLYGSALPVGGESTHAVLTGHSGLPEASLLTDLHKLGLGDEFVIEVAGATLTYRVDQILTVDPDEGEALRQIPGGDYVTLLTCTPIGINTQRLLVRGERVSDGDHAVSQSTVPRSPTDPGPPWWVAPVLGGAGLAAVIAWPRRPRGVDE